MSSMVKVAVVVLALPQSSVAVKVTLALPVAPVSYTHLTLPTTAYV